MKFLTGELYQLVSLKGSDFEQWS